jgi:hypothetical protein
LAVVLPLRRDEADPFTLVLEGAEGLPAAVLAPGFCGREGRRVYHHDVSGLDRRAGAGRGAQSSRDLTPAMSLIRSPAGASITITVRIKPADAKKKLKVASFPSTSDTSRDPR